MSKETQYYYFTRNNMGYRHGYGMTRDRSRWTVFTKDEIERMERPYGCRSKGTFTPNTENQ